MKPAVSFLISWVPPLRNLCRPSAIGTCMIQDVRLPCDPARTLVILVHVPLQIVHRLGRSGRELSNDPKPAIGRSEQQVWGNHFRCRGRRREGSCQMVFETGCHFCSGLTRSETRYVLMQAERCSAFNLLSQAEGQEVRIALTTLSATSEMRGNEPTSAMTTPSPPSRIPSSAVTLCVAISL